MPYIDIHIYIYNIVDDEVIRLCMHSVGVTGSIGTSKSGINYFAYYGNIIIDLWCTSIMCVNAYFDVVSFVPSAVKRVPKFSFRKVEYSRFQVNIINIILCRGDHRILCYSKPRVNLIK